jgi:hypothetical protein
MIEYTSKNSHSIARELFVFPKNIISGNVSSGKTATGRNNGGIYYGSYYNEATS